MCLQEWEKPAPIDYLAAFGAKHDHNFSKILKQMFGKGGKYLLDLLQQQNVTKIQFQTLPIHTERASLIF
jgi:hypothetical protein